MNIGDHVRIVAGPAETGTSFRVGDKAYIIGYTAHGNYRLDRGSRCWVFRSDWLELVTTQPEPVLTPIAGKEIFGV